MKTLRFLHASDLHLGGPVAAPDPAVAALAARARAQGLDRLVGLSRKRGVDLVLLAGDIFHTPQPPLAAGLALTRACAAWQEMGARVFIAPGNHDPYTPESFWTNWQDPQGVHVFSPEPQGVELAEYGIWLAGAGHENSHVERDLAAALPPPPAGLTGLALLHADLPGSRDSDAHKPYAPARLETLRQSPFAYWALGHWHKPTQLSESPRVIMCGSHQAAHLAEPGPRGAYWVEMSGEHVSAEFIPTSPLIFHDLILDDLSRIADPSALVEMVHGYIGQPLDAAGCLRLTLKGPCPLWQRLSGPETAEAAAALKDALGLEGLVLRSLELTPPVDQQTLLDRPDVLGRMLRLLSQAGQDDDHLAALEQKILGGLHPMAKNLEPDERRVWLREQLEQARSLALRELWQGGNGGRQ